MSENAAITPLNDGNFDETLATGTWLVDFWAPWCAPCRMQGQMIDAALAQFEAAGIRIAKVNVDEAQALAMRFKVASIPTLLLFKNGQMTASFTGVQPIERLIAAAK